MNKTIIALLIAIASMGFAVYECHQSNYYADKAIEYATKYRDELKRANDLEARLNDTGLDICIEDAAEGDWCAVEYDDEGNRVDTVLHKNERN